MTTEKENQHFVPRFYLKKFSNRNDDKSIGMFLKDKSKFIKCASIEGQAQKPFYYGKDGKLEDRLAQIEYHASIVLNKVCESLQIIKEPFEDYFRLLHFPINLCMRNPIQANTLLKSDEGFNNHFSKFKSHPEIDSLIENKLTGEQAIVFAALQSSRISKLCLDLESKLIVNKTKIPFITSDNPTIKYNTISEPYIGMSASFVSVGLQIFLPISPTLMIFFYDPKAYRIETNTDETILIKEDSEIFQLNLMQALNSSNCLYFNENISETDIAAIITATTKYSLPNKITPIEFGSYFFQTISELKMNLNLNAIKPLTKQLVIPTGRPIFPMRIHAQKMREFFEKTDSNE